MTVASNMIMIQDWLSMNPLIAGALLIWALAWKGFALWKAAQLQHRNWFVAILVLNTLGLLEIIYLFGIARKYSVEVVEK